MSNPVPLTVRCYSWFPIHIKGIYDNESHEWKLPLGMKNWIGDFVQGQWAETRPSERTLFLFEDKMDAMKFRTIWFDNLHENADG